MDIFEGMELMVISTSVDSKMSRVMIRQVKDTYCIPEVCRPHSLTSIQTHYVLSTIQTEGSQC